jgi:hypothetical protein
MIKNQLMKLMDLNEVFDNPADEMDQVKVMKKIQTN